jgi:hypothetical protein
VHYKVLPWALVALVLLGAAVFWLLTGSTSYEFSNEYLSSETTAQSDGFLEHLLSTEHYAAHHQVYKEQHTPLFPLTNNNRIGFACATVGLMIAAGGGIGRGGILVPIYILVMGFSLKHGIPLSNITILGGALANMLLNSSKRHPLADRPLVDWALILVMEPLMIAGALIFPRLFWSSCWWCYSHSQPILL